MKFDQNLLRIMKPPFFSSLEDHLRLLSASYLFCLTAQDLLNEWMKDKITFEPEDLDYVDEYTGPTQAEIKQEWDDLLQQDHYKTDNEPKKIGA